MMSGNRGGSNGREERMLSLDTEGVRGEAVRIMSDGQTGDLETEESWCGPVPVATK